MSGEGFMADVDRVILKALQHLENALPALDMEKCLPVPLKPNYWQHIFIGRENICRYYEVKGLLSLLLTFNVCILQG